MEKARDTDRVEHICGRQVSAVMMVPRMFGVTAFEDDGSTLYETAGELDDAAPGSCEDVGYWCPHCLRFVAEDELVPVWAE